MKEIGIPRKDKVEFIQNVKSRSSNSINSNSKTVSCCTHRKTNLNDDKIINGILFLQGTFSDDDDNDDDMNETTPVLSALNDAKNDGDISPNDKKPPGGDIQIVVDEPTEETSATQNVDETSRASPSEASFVSIDNTSHHHALFYIESTIFNPSTGGSSVSNGSGEIIAAEVAQADAKAASPDNIRNGAKTVPKVEDVPAVASNGQVRKNSLNVRQTVKRVFDHFSVDQYLLPPQPKWHHRLRQSLLLPPHGPVGKLFTLAIMVVTLWLTW